MIDLLQKIAIMRGRRYWWDDIDADCQANAVFSILSLVVNGHASSLRDET